MNKKLYTSGLRHVAIYVEALEACEHFYTSFLGMIVEWRPDENNIYLTSGNDNLALHRAPVGFQAEKHQKLDHIGFIIDTIEDVDSWYEFLVENNIDIATPPKTHRDGARSFYCRDPDGTHVQMIFHPPIVENNSTNERALKFLDSQ